MNALIYRPGEHRSDFLPRTPSKNDKNIAGLAFHKY